MKIKNYGIILGIIAAIVGYFIIQPYMFLCLGSWYAGKTGNVKLTFDELAVKTSFLDFQKNDTLSSIISTLVGVKDYQKALPYIKLKAILSRNLNDYNNEYIVFMGLKDYDNALIVAKYSLDSRTAELRTYIAMGDTKNARAIYNANIDLPSRKEFYLAQIQTLEKNYKAAYKTINHYIASQNDSNSLQALELKADLEKRLGFKTDYEKTNIEITYLRRELMKNNIYFVYNIRSNEYVIRTYN